VVVRLGGCAGAAARAGTLVETILGGRLPPLQLGLPGLAWDGDVNANALAAAALLIVPLGVSVLLLPTGERIDWFGLLPAGAIVVAVGAVILATSHSRSAAIAVWLTLVGLLVGRTGTRFWRAVMGAAIVAPVFVATGSAVFLNNQAFLREAGGYWSSARGRAQIMSQGFERWKEHPWLGIGLNEFRRVYKPKEGDIPQAADVVHVHNIVLQTALDIGTVGSVAYWGLLSLLFSRAAEAANGPSRLARAAAIGSTFSLITVHLFGLSDAVPLGAKIGLFQWAAAGLILAAWRVQCGPPAVTREQVAT
jgi:O-antigen ligase